MTFLEIIIYAAVFAIVVWWALNANFAPCDECDYDCRQGRDCPKKDLQN